MRMNGRSILHKYIQSRSRKYKSHTRPYTYFNREFPSGGNTSGKGPVPLRAGRVLLWWPYPLHYFSTDSHIGHPLIQALTRPHQPYILFRGSQIGDPRASFDMAVFCQPTDGVCPRPGTTSTVDCLPCAPPSSTNRFFTRLPLSLFTSVSTFCDRPRWSSSM